MTEEELSLELFAIKSRFFQDIPHPKLILKAINQVEKLLSVIPVLPAKEPLNKDQPLMQSLQEYVSILYPLKTEIAQTTGAENLYKALNNLYALQLALIKKMAAYISEEVDLKDAIIKQSDPIEAYRIIQFMQHQNLSENQIKTYICEETKNHAGTEFSVLTKACLQCYKIYGNG